jgi:flagellar protein FlaH
MKEEILAPFRAAANVYLETSINKVGGIVNRVAFVRRYSNAQGRIDNSIVFRVEAGTGIILEIMAVS